MAALMSPSVTTASSQVSKPSITNSASEVTTQSLSGLTGISPSHLLANIQSGLTFRPQLDLTRFNPTGLPSPSSLLFPYLMNSGTRSFQHQWAAQKGLSSLPCQKGTKKRYQTIYLALKNSNLNTRWYFVHIRKK